MLGQTTVPLVGLVDTAIIGRTGDAAALAGVALGVSVINFVFWAFGFLRMGVTGMTAQAHGAGDADEVRALMARGILAGLALGALLVVAQLAIVPIAFGVLSGHGAMDAAAHEFVSARFFGAPAALAWYAVVGWLYGIGRTRASLALQLVMNAANIALDLLFVWHFDMGARGVGLGTALAEWIALFSGMAMIARILGSEGRAALRRQGARLFDRAAWRQLLIVNGDIMIRTLALLAMFLWLSNAGARLGAEPLAANHVLMQLVSLFAFILDGFCFTAESRVGQAIGAGSRADLTRAVRLTGEFAIGCGVVACLLSLAFGGLLIDFLTSNAEVRERAHALLPLAAMAPIVGVPAWLLDGVFIGATRGRTLRNAALLATALYVATDYALRPFGPIGIWIALLVSYGYRAVPLALAFPRLRMSVGLAPREGA